MSRIKYKRHVVERQKRICFEIKEDIIKGNIESIEKETLVPLVDKEKNMSRLVKRYLGKKFAVKVQRLMVRHSLINLPNTGAVLPPPPRSENN